MNKEVKDVFRDLNLATSAAASKVYRVLSGAVTDRVIYRVIAGEVGQAVHDRVRDNLPLYALTHDFINRFYSNQK